jgi:glycine/D-amino acid oxidase-like deaminating enzyme/nitrite reductase/ring-hydroxylating ferredoxin subunit
MEKSAESVSVWMDTVEVPSFPPLKEDTEAEVCVIGAGIAGLTSAYLLSKKGVKVVVLDDGSIISGETQRTTAHVSNVLDYRYFEIESVRGTEGAKMTAESHTAAIDQIEKNVNDEHIDCDFFRVDGYLFLGEGQKEDILDRELKAVHRAGMTGVKKLDKVPFPHAELGPCLQYPQQAQFHPGKYLIGLAKAIEKNGGRIFTHTHAAKIEEKKQPVIVHTNQNASVKAQRLIVATNAPVNDNVRIFSKQTPYRSYVIGLRIPHGSVPANLYWDTLDPFHYIRIQKDAHGDVLIVGGEDHRSAQENDMAERLDELEKWTKKRLGIEAKRAYGWSGQVMNSLDGLALIGKKPGGKEWSLIATGDSGLGMTHGTIAGMMLSEMAAGKKHPWTKLYDPSRLPLKSIGDYVKDNMETGSIATKDWLTPGEVKHAKDIKPDSGGVLRRGIKKIALYRDKDGKEHAYSAICPHKGCIVHWNDGEKSWDCPCHGSRYDAHGHVLNGPTIKDLKPVTWK